MGLSSKLFLLSGDDTLHALAGTAFMRMLRQDDIARLPDFAGQRRNRTRRQATKPHETSRDAASSCTWDVARRRSRDSDSNSSTSGRPCGPAWDVLRQGKTGYGMCRSP